MALDLRRRCQPNHSLCCCALPLTLCAKEIVRSGALRGELLRSRFGSVRVSGTSSYCEPICGRKHWGGITITVCSAIESDVRHRTRKNLQILWGARNPSTDSFAARVLATWMIGSPVPVALESARKFVRSLAKGRRRAQTRRLRPYPVARSRSSGNGFSPAVSLPERPWR